MFTACSRTTYLGMHICISACRWMHVCPSHSISLSPTNSIILVLFATDFSMYVQQYKSCHFIDDPLYSMHSVVNVNDCFVANSTVFNSIHYIKRCIVHRINTVRCNRNEAIIKWIKCSHVRWWQQCSDAFVCACIMDKFVSLLFDSIALNWSNGMRKNWSNE